MISYQSITERRCRCSESHAGNDKGRKENWKRYNPGQARNKIGGAQEVGQEGDRCPSAGPYFGQQKKNGERCNPGKKSIPFEAKREVVQPTRCDGSRCDENPI